MHNQAEHLARMKPPFEHSEYVRLVQLLNYSATFRTRAILKISISNLQENMLAKNTINSPEQKNTLALYSNKERKGVEDRLSTRKIHRIISFVKESTQTEQRYINRSLIGRRIFYRRQ